MNSTRKTPRPPTLPTFPHPTGDAAKEARRFRHALYLVACALNRIELELESLPIPKLVNSRASLDRDYGASEQAPRGFGPSRVTREQMGNFTDMHILPKLSSIIEHLERVEEIIDR